ncbi:MAG: lysine--tRNA ligase [Acidobacteria bacterium]|nr:lysine--tRNA ligase [Acidobacteriota bacterium]MBI3470397.1 lysine--tRNA ligase [Candidatus Solibacter usitatus]
MEETKPTPPLAALREIRLQKAASLRALGLDPYPSRSARTHYAAAITGNFEAHEGRPVTVAGRLISWRKQGALAFGHIQDQTGPIQLMLRRDGVKPTDPEAGTLGYADLHLLDVGDLVEAAGTAGKTQRGEISVMVREFRLLTKTLRPLPEKWSGLKDRETILRKRYLDTIVNPEHKATFEAMARMLFAIRTFLNQRGFLEIPTPILQAQYGGGTAQPFLTHVNALDCDMYLSISHELYLKRLIAAGFDKVYTIGRYFRNEGIDRSHHPEFQMIETMTAYENYEYNMALIEDLFRFVATEAFGRTEFTVRGHPVDFGQPWPRLSMRQAVLDKTGVDFAACATAGDANARLAELGIHEPQPSAGEAMVKAFEMRVEESLIQPTLVYGHPVEISPLAKPMSGDPRFAERFEIFIAGMECGDNWSEQNDPVKLLETWRRNYRPEDRDSGQFHPLDFDFVEMLEHGMPPTTGIGPGIERMAMIFTGKEDIYDVIFFPLMKPHVSPVNRQIFGLE